MLSELYRLRNSERNIHVVSHSATNPKTIFTTISSWIYIYNPLYKSPITIIELVERFVFIQTLYCSTTNSRETPIHTPFEVH